MGEVLEIVKAMVSPCEKLIGAVQCAIGKAYEPTHIKKLADARAYEIDTLGQAMRDSCDIPIVYDQQPLAMNTLDFDAFAKRTQHRLAYQELVKQKNIENVANHAYTLLEDIPNVPDVPVDSDWMLRFFNSVQDISNEDMQQIWANILAEEITKPGAVSLRTLTILAQMTASEAKLFEYISHFVLHCESDLPDIDDYFIPSNHEIINAAKISFADIVQLEEIGLLSPHAFVSVGFDIQAQEEKYIYHNDKQVLKVYNSGTNCTKFTGSVYILNYSAIELVNIIAPKDAHDLFGDYLNACISSFQSMDVFGKKDANIIISKCKI